MIMRMRMMMRMMMMRIAVVTAAFRNKECSRSTTTTNNNNNEKKDDDDDDVIDLDEVDRLIEREFEVERIMKAWIDEQNAQKQKGEPTMTLPLPYSVRVCMENDSDAMIPFVYETAWDDLICRFDRAPNNTIPRVETWAVWPEWKDSEDAFWLTAGYLCCGDAKWNRYQYDGMTVTGMESEAWDEDVVGLLAYYPTNTTGKASNHTTTPCPFPAFCMRLLKTEEELDRLIQNY